MPPPQYQAAQFLSALQALLPRGPVWPRDFGTAQATVLGSLTPVYERGSARAAQVVAEAFPPTTYELLPEWEGALGLPDLCSGAVAGTIQRRAQVVARFLGPIDQRPADYVSYAASLGYDVAVQVFAPFRLGQSRMGDQLGSDDWSHTWAVVADATTVVYFTLGQSAMGDPLRSWGNALLECELSAVSPPHTILSFFYQLPPVTTEAGENLLTEAGEILIQGVTT